MLPVQRRRRYVVCYNPKEAARQRKHRAQVLEELKGELARLRQSHDGAHSKRGCALRASRRYGRYVRVTRTGRALIDASAVKATERLDGKFVVHSNDDTLSATDMALGYKESGGNYFSMQRSLILDIRIGHNHRAACVVWPVSPASCEQQVAIHY